MDLWNCAVRLAFSSATLLFLLWPTAASLQAQEARPDVVVSMYFVGEKVACPPDGYPDADEESTRSRCPTWTFSDLADLSRQATPVQQSIPPEQLQLGQALLDSIEAFSDDCTIAVPCADEPDRRYSIVLAFEVNDLRDFRGQEIAIRRLLPDRSRLPKYSASGELSQRGRWINHQRADIFLPSYSVRWELQIGEWRWNLGTEQ